MPQFDLSSFPSQIFWFAVFFGIILVVNSLFIVPKLYNIFQNRRNKLAEDQKLIEKYKIESEIFNQKSKKIQTELENELKFIQDQYRQRLERYISSKKDELADNILEIEKLHIKKFEQFQRELEKYENDFSESLSKTITNRILVDKNFL